MRIKIKQQINKKHNIKKMETNFYRNKILDKQYLKIYLDSMLK